MSGIPCAPSIDTGIMFSIHRGHSFFNHPPASLPHATKITAMATGPWTCVIKLYCTTTLSQDWWCVLLNNWSKYN